MLTGHPSAALRRGSIRGNPSPAPTPRASFEEEAGPLVPHQQPTERRAEKGSPGRNTLQHSEKHTVTAEGPERPT